MKGTFAQVYKKIGPLSFRPPCHFIGLIARGTLNLQEWHNQGNPGFLPDFRMNEHPPIDELHPLKHNGKEKGRAEKLKS